VAYRITGSIWSIRIGVSAPVPSPALRHPGLEDIRRRGAVPILAGGTGFFLRVLTHPLFEEPPLDPAAKECWKVYLRDVPLPRLESWAAALDPAAAARVTDRQRLARAS
jgi:tRNA dimethylallyltransferase